jgi:hypothetical protein
MSARNRILLIGFDPTPFRGVDADLVDAAIAMGEVRLRERGFETDYCLVEPCRRGADHRGAAGEGLRLRRGRRRDPQARTLLEWFEQVVNLIHEHAPHAVIAFNTTGENSVDGVLRWLPAPTAAT